jgi:hypothetical protein
MVPKRLLQFTMAALLGAVSTLSAQAPALRVERDGRASAVLSAEALRRLPSDTVSLSSHGAPPVTYRAVKLLDVMAAAGSPLDSLRIGRTGWVVAALAKDGYVALFSAAEIEPKIGPTRVMVAFERVGAPLRETEAPFHLIVPTDALGTRSARMVTTLRIFDALSEKPTR